MLPCAVNGVLRCRRWLMAAMTAPCSDLLRRAADGVTQQLTMLDASRHDVGKQPTAVDTSSIDVASARWR